MKNKKKLFIILIFFIALIITIQEQGMLGLTNRKAKVFLPDFSFEKKLIIAACPTFHYMLEKIDNQNIVIKKTGSTRESLEVLNQGQVDLIISGRVLRPEETEFLFEVIGPGYDFISEKEMFIFDNEMNSITFYTDLDLEKIIANFDYITKDNLIKTDNPYDYLNKGIAVVFLEDKLKGEMVHIFNQNQSRIRFSRRPRLYYSNNLSMNDLNFIKEIIKEN